MRALAPLLLAVLTVLLCTGPAAVASANAPETGPVVTAGADCSHPSSMLVSGHGDQVPRRAGGDPTGPSVTPPETVAVVAAGHADVAPPEVPERARVGPSPVEQLCVDRN
ncbi:hypothetical protein WIS52_22760 [Pseudonocardia nematodicida]|uniref:Secreted protein n=1 Tax=Pseudonocardia nematodicida TaxID=1206997 RepID=A0ABV1KFQ5_9PSEU